ncbi:hypothetical protein [Tenacibaculum sp. IB213877]|uniref:hypothetical protein n=1 Tax=Tenacibaculum sp. IB213877 TaxID=3097351 RepID=UPI002A5A7119|nr:hypothetical protein [Tenacibaculum sp. IB213877]MDY0781634.1 hypothetical protein [Tenacibaculum sp. IB213877]
MKTQSYNIVAFLLLISSTVVAQKFDKKYSENFNVNNDVTIRIDATNSDIDVTTWNKNQVQVDAVIEVEGISKEEAEKYFKNWTFEALGNKSSVQITSKSKAFQHFGNDFIVFNNDNFEMPEIVIPEMPEFPEMPEIPEINFEMPKIPEFKGLEELEFDFDKFAEEGGNYFFRWKDDVHDITIKSKKEWEEFKKSREYANYKKEMEKSREKMRKEFKEAREHMKKIDREKLKEDLRRAREEYKRIDREKIRQEIAKSREEIKKAREEYKNLRGFYVHPEGKEITINGKKVKINRKITVKVPKGATFKLNTRHCKVKLPDTKATGKVSYGTFKAHKLQGGDLNISFSPVTIDDMNTCTVSLNNVSNAKVISISDAKLSSNSSEVIIENVHQNVDLTNKFGDLQVLRLHPNYKNFTLLLNSSNAVININGLKDKLTYDVKDYVKNYANGDLGFNGSFTVNTENKGVRISGKYSQLKLQK